MHTRRVSGRSQIAAPAEGSVQSGNVADWGTQRTLQLGSRVSRWFSHTLDVYASFALPFE
jgi:hypothetical protein